MGRETRRKQNLSQEQIDTPCGHSNKVAESIVPSTSLSSPSVLYPALSDFALLYFTRVKDKAVPKDYSQEFLSLEIPVRRAAKRSQVSAALISDSMAATALSVLRRNADQRATEIGSIGDQQLIAADLKPRKFRTKWQRAVCDGPAARKDAELAGETDGYNCSRICSDRQTLQWEDSSVKIRVRYNYLVAAVVLGRFGRESGPFKSLLDGSLRLTGLASPTIGDNLLSTSRSGIRSLAFVEHSNLFISPSSSCRKWLGLRTS